MLIVLQLPVLATFAQVSTVQDLRMTWKQKVLDVPTIKGRIGIVDFAYTFFRAYPELSLSEATIAMMNDFKRNHETVGDSDFVLDRLCRYLKVVYDGDIRKVEMKCWCSFDNHQLVAVNIMGGAESDKPLLMFYDFDPVPSTLSPLQTFPFDKEVAMDGCRIVLSRWGEDIEVVADASGDIALLHWNGTGGFMYDGPERRADKAMEPLLFGSDTCNDQGLRTGDLIFVGFLPEYDAHDSVEMSSAIVVSTGDGAANYVHVAIVDVGDDGVWIIDASPQRGVDRYPIDTFLMESVLRDGSFPRFQVMRLVDHTNVAEYVEKARGFIGQPYDSCFLPDNNAQYCSELVRNAYMKDASESFFNDAPMNFKSPDGEYSSYWVNWFKKIDRPIPQGVLGTNPNDMSKSQCLTTVDIDLIRYCKERRP